MRFLLTFILLNIFVSSFSQDTIRISDDLHIYKDGKIIQKEFRSSKNYIKIIYFYDNSGVLIHRCWYNKNGKLLSVSLEN